DQLAAAGRDHGKRTRPLARQDAPGRRLCRRRRRTAGDDERQAEDDESGRTTHDPYMITPTTWAALFGGARHEVGVGLAFGRRGDGLTGALTRHDMHRARAR